MSQSDTTSKAIPVSHPVAEYHDRGMAGHQWKFRFANGYGASVIQGPHTYGGNAGQYEVGVLDGDSRLIYVTPVTSDVLGYLSPAELQSALDQIAALPAGRDGWREEFRVADELKAAGLQAEADTYDDGLITLKLSIDDARRVAGFLAKAADQ